MRIIRASEIGSFLYCQRAWWYRSQGIPGENQAELAGGSEFHKQHGRRVVVSGLLRAAGLLLLLVAAALIAVELTMGLLR